MIRSLYSGISGLRNEQVKMDITSHNIANVNTSGYKAQRVTFKEGFSQILRGATRPPGDSGGTNPMQAGLGMAVGSIDSIMTQGALQSTGQITDLAVEGRAFFAFSNGEGNFYSRNGALQMDSTGRLVSPANGFKLQGLTANSDGVIEGTAVPGDIRLPYGEKSPARATEQVGFACNLDSDSAGVGTVLHTARYLVYGKAADANVVPPVVSSNLRQLFDQNGNDLNIKTNDVLKIIYTDMTNPTTPVPVERRFVVKDDSTLDNLAAEIQTALGGAYQVTVNPNTGKLDIMGNGGAMNLTVKNDTRPTSNQYVSSLFLWSDMVGSTVDVNGNAVPDTCTGNVLAPADLTDPLAKVMDASGQALGLENSDVIKVSGSIGGVNLEDDSESDRDHNNIDDGGLIFSNGTNLKNDGVTVDPNAAVDAATGAPLPATTMKDLLNYIQGRLRLPDTIPNTAGSDDKSIELNVADTGDARAPVGSIMIRGQAGTAFALSGISVSASNSNNDKVTTTAFNSNMIPTELQTARDTTVHSTSIEIFDESGAAHTMTTTFTHSGTPNKWLWEITMNGSEQIFGGNRGTLTFSPNGSPAAWTFDDATANTFRFNPMNGAGEMKIDLNIGGPDIFTGITQFRSVTTTAAKDQDGYPMGKLSEISIGEDGSVNGLFTNGTNRMLAKVLLADFNNPAGLLRTGDSMWSVSNNSGEAVLHRPGEGTSSKIKPGALEMSNVDLASEFTDLITTQRGYQAASKVITTSDSLLQELVQLVR